MWHVFPKTPRRENVVNSLEHIVDVDGLSLNYYRAANGLVILTTISVSISQNELVNKRCCICLAVVINQKQGMLSLAFSMFFSLHDSKCRRRSGHDFSL